MTFSYVNIKYLSVCIDAYFYLTNYAISNDVITNHVVKEKYYFH